MSEIVKVKSTHPASQGPFVLKYRSDMTADDVLYTEPKADEKKPKAENEKMPVFSSEKVAAQAVEAAAKHGFNLADLVGTGKKGAITMDDLNSAIEAAEAAAAEKGE